MFGNARYVIKICQFLTVKLNAYVLLMCYIFYFKVLNRNWHNGLVSQQQVKTSFVTSNSSCDWTNVVAESDVIAINDQWILIGSFSSRHFEVYDRKLVFKHVGIFILFLTRLIKIM